MLISVVVSYSLPQRLRSTPTSPTMSNQTRMLCNSNTPPRHVVANYVARDHLGAGASASHPQPQSHQSVHSLVQPTTIASICALSSATNHNRINLRTRQHINTDTIQLSLTMTLCARSRNLYMNTELSLVVSHVRPSIRLSGFSCDS